MNIEKEALYCEKCGDCLERDEEVKVRGYIYCWKCVAECDYCGNIYLSDELAELDRLRVCTVCAAKVRKG